MRTTNSKLIGRYFFRGIIGLFTLTLLSTVFPGCSVGYVLKSAYFQAELLGKREPIQDLRSQDQFNEDELRALDRIRDVKHYGAEIGLKATDNYDTFAADWDRKIWNLSACEELEFKPKKWTFPIVGKIPYLGFFRRQDADPWIKRLENKGYETYIRTAGAYSTLGWFKDPVLPGMLKWNDYRLADTVLHELAHATIWIKGSVKFNESFANFVGEVAAFEYLDNRFGPTSTQMLNALKNFEDLQKWRALLRDLYQDLDTVYSNQTLNDSEKRRQKEALFASMTERVVMAQFQNPDRFHRAVAKGTWNNARMIQYKTYNHNRDYFRAIYEQENRDLLRFMRAIETITDGQKDPFQALKEAALNGQK
jgi:predicted aminopeptidase